MQGLGFRVYPKPKRIVLVRPGAQDPLNPTLQNALVTVGCLVMLENLIKLQNEFKFRERLPELTSKTH